jgi:predicted chitinase
MADELEKGTIPDTPPVEAKATQGAVAGIAALKKACIEGGLTSKYAQCAVLGIVGVESKWMYDSQEDPTYRKRTLLKKRATEADAERYGADASGKGLSRQEFFGWFYGTKRGKTPAEGQYYGRGFLQLSLIATYTDIGKLLGEDLLKDPEKVISNPEYGAKVAVAIVKLKVPKWKEEQWKPGFFNKLLQGVGGVEDGWPLKQRYYEYFLGGSADAAPTNKDAVSTVVNKTPKEIDAAPVNKKEAYSEDRSINFSAEGFTDPEGKYPLRDFMNEPDTNRLARGITEGTSVKFKDSTRRTNIPIANGAGSEEDEGAWNQPETVYNTVYPFNKVFESESGHILEFDDSLDGERVNLYHRKGTFIEIDPNGSQINYIVGDGYYIVENNGNIYVNGTCNITVASELNILCQGNANIEVNGTADVVVHDDLNIGVAKDLNIAVGGDYNLKVEGNYNSQVGKTSNTRSIGTMSIESTDALKLKTAKTMSMEGGDTASTAETLMKMSSSFKLETPADFQIKANTFTLDVATDTKIKTKTLLVEVEETTKIKTDKFQLDTKTDTKILTGTFNTTTNTGILQLNSVATAVINAGGIISATAPKIDLNGAAIPPTVITAISDKVEPLPLLGAPKVPVDFKGDPVKDRKEEQVLVDTVLNPAGTFNPNTLSDVVIDSVLNNIPLVGDALSLFGDSAPDVYDVKYAGAPIESKTTLSSAGATTSPYSRLMVPPVIGPGKSPKNNLTTPERRTDGVSKYETDEDWNSPNGQKAWNKITSTSDYENNNVDPSVPTDPTENVVGTGGGGSTKDISSDKLADINGKDDFPLSYQLSEHFTLGMLMYGGNKLKEQKVRGVLYTKQMIVANLTELCENILEKIWDELGTCRGGGSGATWYLSEGFRVYGHTDGESKTSHHLAGRAADIHVIPDTKDAIFETAVKLEKILPYQELFMEYAKGGSSHWIHISYDKNDKSKELETWNGHHKANKGLVKLYSGNKK